MSDQETWAFRQTNIAVQQQFSVNQRRNAAQLYVDAAEWLSFAVFFTPAPPGKQSCCSQRPLKRADGAFPAFAILYISGSYKIHHFIGAEARNKMLKHEGGVILCLCLSLRSRHPPGLFFFTIQQYTQWWKRDKSLRERRLTSRIESRDDDDDDDEKNAMRELEQQQKQNDCSNPAAMTTTTKRETREFATTATTKLR